MYPRYTHRDGLGTQVRVTLPDGTTRHNHATTSVGYGSSSDKTVHFGMANDITAKSVEIQWPSGVRQRLQDVGCDRYLAITELQ